MSAQKSVLVVEDESSLARFVQLNLQARGHRVIIATEAEEAWAVMKSGPVPDLVLLDLILPRQSGWDLLDWMAADEALETMPVVIISALAGKENRAKALALGVTDYLVKPIGAPELIGCVDKLFKDECDGA
jgi:DNA-binding response OmpR family regulator